MGAFKTTTNTIINWLQNNGEINEVTHGDINEVDLSTVSYFPLVHVIYLDTTYNDGYTTFNYQILFLDTFSENTDDKIDILDNMNEVVTQFTKAITNGSLFNAQIRVSTTPSADVMYDQLQNRLYGWSLTVALDVPNGIDICV